MTALAVLAIAIFVDWRAAVFLVLAVMIAKRRRTPMKTYQISNTASDLDLDTVDWVGLAGSEIPPGGCDVTASE